MSVAALGVLAAVAFALLGLRVHGTLHTSAFDLGFFDQIVWNTAHGRLFETTYTPHAYNFAGQHFEPVLFLFAALYRLFGAGPRLLIVAQAVVVGAAAIPLYLVARRQGGVWPAVLLAAAFLLAPQLERGVDFGFHPDLLLPLFAFSAYAAQVYRRRALFLVFAALTLLVKEDAFLVVLALGWLAWFDGRRRAGAAVAAAALLWGVVVLVFVMPALRHGYPSDLAERYGYLGDTPVSIVAGGLTHPARVVGHLAQFGTLATVLGMLAVAGFLPVFAPEALLAAVPPALVGLLATHPEQRSLDLQYAAPVLAVLFIAATRGLGVVRRCSGSGRLPAAVRHRRIGGHAALSVAFAALAVAAAGVGFLMRGPYPPGGAYASGRFRGDGDGAALTRVARLIPADASLSAQTGLLPHLSQRTVQYEFPRLDGARYVVLQDGGIVSGQSLGTYGGYDTTRAALPSLGYTEIAHDHGIHLYEHKGP